MSTRQEILSTFIFVSVLISIQGYCKEKFTQGKQIKQMGHILSHRDRIIPENNILKDRLDNLLPILMDESNIDMWIVINREYVENSLFYTLVPQPVFAARRTTILIFNKTKSGQSIEVEKITVSRYPIDGFYTSVWQGGSWQQQWQRLAEIVAQRDPKTIAINVSKD